MFSSNVNIQDTVRSEIDASLKRLLFNNKQITNESIAIILYNMTNSDGNESCELNLDSKRSNEDDSTGDDENSKVLHSKNEFADNITFF